MAAELIWIVTLAALHICKFTQCILLCRTKLLVQNKIKVISRCQNWKPPNQCYERVLGRSSFGIAAGYSPWAWVLACHGLMGAKITPWHAWWRTHSFFLLAEVCLLFFKIFIVIQLQLYAFLPHPSTPPQPNPPPSPTSILPLDFVHVSFIVENSFLTNRWSRSSLWNRDYISCSLGQETIT